MLCDSKNVNINSLIDYWQRIHMEFKKIDDKKFQCLLFEEDLEEK